eukprot:c21014_g4_i1 orf=133-900(-)
MFECWSLAFLFPRTEFGFKSAQTICIMSRCFPFPPPGYDKKANIVDLGLPSKGHKHKDKKIKRKKDCETNGVVHDKDRQSTTVHGTALVNDVLHSKKQRQLKSQIAAAVEQPVDRSRGGVADGADNQKHSDITICQPELYNKDKRGNGKVASKLSNFSGSSSSNGNKGIGETFPSSRHRFESDHVVAEQRHSDILTQAESGSTHDDQEWIFLHNICSYPKVKFQIKKHSGASQVWAEVLYLPSVDIYALPYVIPY